MGYSAIKIPCFVYICVLVVGTFGNKQPRNAVTDPNQLWPNGRVPYTFHPGIDAYRKVHLLAGMKQIMTSAYSGGRPCVLFVPRTNEADYIEFRFVVEGGLGGAHVGKAGGKQYININRDVTQDNILQDIMFALGIHPEVARPDRNNVLDIINGNINASFSHSFQIEPDTDTFSQPFDYQTVVMYGPYFGAIDRSMPTIKTKFSGYTIGQTVSLSDNDVNLLQHIYECSLDSSHRVDLLGPLVFECHFHSGMCQFIQDTRDEFNWAYRTGPSSGNGPNADNSNGMGGYALAQSAGHHTLMARLKIPDLPAGEYCLVAWMFAYGANGGEIRAVQTTNDGPKTLFSASGLPHKMWYHGSKTITSWNSPVSISIEAVMGNNDQGDVAVDDVYVYKGECIDWY